MKDESCVIVRCSTIGGDIGGDARWSMHDAFVTGEEAAAMTCCNTDRLDSSRVERGTTCSAAWVM